LRQVSRTTDLVARLGGDEFLVVIENVDDSAMLQALVRRMQRTVTEPVVVEGRTVRPGVSIGVVTSGEVTDPEELLRLADAAMYRAKARARSAQDAAASPG
jgi:diguanylate cyclase (GGDEF)-like protein